jgi:putative ABC transport system permease protein
VFRDGVRVMAIGLGAGHVAGAWLARTLTGLLYEVRPADPLALASVALALSFAGALAAYLPARRATRVNTTVALGDR